MARAACRKWAKTVGGERVVRESAKWYAAYTDAAGARHRVLGYRDRAATEQLAARRERESARDAEGLSDPHRRHKGRPLAGRRGRRPKNWDRRVAPREPIGSV